MNVLFDEMASDLSSFMAGKSDLIMCPLCLVYFGKTDINPATLSEEHIVPKSAGGKLTTITCKKCNSTAGADIDSHFARMVRFANTRHKGGEIAGRVKIKGSVGSPVQVSFTERGLHCQLQLTTPYVGEEFARRFRQYATGERQLVFNVDRNVDGSKLVASIVKMAYLALFKDWGYKYILLQARDWIREGIRFDREEREWLRPLVIPADLSYFSGLPEKPTRMSFETTISGINVACCIISDLIGPGSLWIILPPMFDMNTNHRHGLHRAAQSIMGKSITGTFHSDRPATLTIH